MAVLDKAKWQEPSFRYETWAELLETPARLEWVLFVGRYYRDLFDEAIAKIVRIAAYSRIEFLVDFDVLRSYIDIDQSNRHESYLIYSWFHYSDRPYSLPAGAFEELSAFLRHLTDIKTHAVNTSRSLDQNGAIRALADSLGVQDADSLAIDDATAEITAKLDDRAIKLNRLVDFLTNKNFKGVVTEYDTSVAKAFQHVLASRPRTETVGRQRRDKHDARNLAIAIDSLRQLRTDPEANIPARFLITCTSILTNLSRYLLEQTAVNDRASTELTEVVARAVSGIEEAKALLYDLPVIHPREATVAEVVGFHDNPRDAYATLKSRRSELREITDYCLDKMALEGSIAGDAKSSLATIISQHKQHVAKLLEGFSRGVLGESSDYNLLEENRSTLIGLVFSEVSNDLLEDMSREQRLEKSTASFLEVASRIDAAMTAIGEIHYEASWKQSHDPPHYKKWCLEQTVGGQSRFQIASMECFTRVEFPGLELDYYVLTWPTYHSSRDFFDALELSVPPRLIKSLASTLEGPNDTGYIREGLLMNTHQGSFAVGVNLNQSNRKSSLFAQVESMRSKLKITRQLMSQPVKIVPGVEQYRLCTLEGDIVLDIDPQEGTTRRCCAVISHLNHSDMIVDLIGQLSTRYIDLAQVKPHVQDALRQFPLPQAIH